MKINYDSVRRDAKKLRALADDCEAAARSCSKYQNELPQYWQGSSADSYTAGLARLNKKNKALANQIEQLAAQITAVANELEEEDRRLAAQIAAKKISGTVSAAKGASSSSRFASDVVPIAATLTNYTPASLTSTVAKISSSTIQDSVSSLISKLFGKR